MKQFVNRIAILVVAALIAAGCASDPNVESAKLHMVNRDWDAMIESAKLAIETNEENPDGYYYLGIAQIQKALTLSVEEREEWYAQAYANLKKAEKLYAAQTTRSQEANNISADLVQTWAGEFNAAVELVDGDFQSTHEDSLKEAILHLRNAVASLPDSIYVRTVLAEAYLAQGNTEMVEETIGSLIRDGLATRDDYIVLANARLQAGRTDAAFEVMSDIVKQYPDDVAVIEWIAFYHIERDNRAEAVRTVQGLIDSDPNQLRYRLLYRDIFLNEINRYIAQAEEKLAEVPEINAEIRTMARARDRDERAIRQRMARAEQIMEETEELFRRADALSLEIADQFKSYVARNPRSIVAWQELGIIYRNRAVSFFDLRDNTDDFDEAARFDAKAKEILGETAYYFEKVVELDEQNTQAWTILFQIYSNLNRMEEALEAQERAGLGG